MVALYGSEVANNFQHALQFLDTTDELSDRYTVIDMGVHTVMDQPLLILAEDGRTELESVPAYTAHTALEDRTDIRLEPDTYDDHEREPLGDWYGRIQFDTLRREARQEYRDRNANQSRQGQAGMSSIDDLFTDTTYWYAHDDAMISAFAQYIDGRDQDDFPEL